MKKYLTRAVIFCGILAFSTPAWSLTIGDVGSIDTLLAQTTISPSSQAAELAWVESQIGTATFIYKDETLASWEELSGSPGVWAHPLTTASDYFLVKTGAGLANTHFLFDNLADFSWAVVFLEDLGITKNDIEKISHISVFNPRQVPEAGTAILLGGGLLALVGYGRRKRKK